MQEQGRSATGEQPIVDVQLPAVVNGQILSGQVDRYRFAAKKGQHLVFAVSAQQLVPYIADAVPGWFQAAITLSDEEGKELAYAGSYRFHPDPVLHYEVPRDGKYVVEIKRLVLSRPRGFHLPHGPGRIALRHRHLPLGRQGGRSHHVAVQGWNLPFASLTEDAKGKTAGIDRLDADRRSGLAQPRCPSRWTPCRNAWSKSPTTRPNMPSR